VSEPSSRPSSSTLHGTTQIDLCLFLSKTVPASSQRPITLSEPRLGPIDRRSVWLYHLPTEVKHINVDSVGMGVRERCVREGTVQTALYIVAVHELCGGWLGMRVVDTEWGRVMALPPRPSEKGGDESMEERQSTMARMGEANTGREPLAGTTTMSLAAQEYRLPCLFIDCSEQFLNGLEPPYVSSPTGRNHGTFSLQDLITSRTFASSLPHSLLRAERQRPSTSTNGASAPIPTATSIRHDRIDVESFATLHTSIRYALEPLQSQSITLNTPLTRISDPPADSPIWSFVDGLLGGSCWESRGRLTDEDMRWLYRFRRSKCQVDEDDDDDGEDWDEEEDGGGKKRKKVKSKADQGDKGYGSSTRRPKHKSHNWGGKSSKAKGNEKQREGEQREVPRRIEFTDREARWSGKSESARNQDGDGESTQKAAVAVAVAGSDGSTESLMLITPTAAKFDLGKRDEPDRRPGLGRLKDDSSSRGRDEDDFRDVESGSLVWGKERKDDVEVAIDWEVGRGGVNDDGSLRDFIAKTRTQTRSRYPSGEDEDEDERSRSQPIALIPHKTEDRPCVRPAPNLGDHSESESESESDEAKKDIPAWVYQIDVVPVDRKVFDRLLELRVEGRIGR